MINNDFYTMTKIVGVTYKNENGVEIQSILPNLKSGDGLFFIRDYYNQYDENAIKVYCKSGHIGYLNKELAAKITPFLSENDDYDLDGRVVEITGDDSKSIGCNIKIWVKNISSLEDITSQSKTPIQKETEPTISTFELILQFIGIVIGALFSGIICWSVLAKIWCFFYIIAIGAFGLAIYMLYLVIKLITISKK